MANHLRLVIVDYPKLTIHDKNTKQALIDMIQAKQINFERSDENYVPMSGLDMVSTHFLIYDVRNLFELKLVFAIRVCYSDRAEKHYLQIPSQNYILNMPIDVQAVYQKYCEARGAIVDCNAWFVDTEYSFANSGLVLSEMGYFAVIKYLIANGYDHMLGATNEKYKASRWLKNILNIEYEFNFMHPTVKSEHKLILASSFNQQWIKDCEIKYKEMYEGRYEVGSASQSKILKFKEPA
ncbi:MAG: hypothetical protein H6623_00380 [Bdellovibrionaceae bacterium]|nr:hypothetical protein [Pseudobdellovibrionaceae bacterium]